MILVETVGAALLMGVACCGACEETALEICNRCAVDDENRPLGLAGTSMVDPLLPTKQAILAALAHRCSKAPWHARPCI